MTDFIPDFGNPPDPNDPEYDRKVLLWLEGTYSTAWDDLKWSTWSALQSTAYGTSLALKSYQKLTLNQGDPAEASFLMDMNYRSAILGPALGTVTLAAFTVESFLRLGYTMAIELVEARSRPSRAAGFTTSIEKKLVAFDKLGTTQRLGALTASAKFMLPAPLARRFDKLYRFRNSLAHDTPSLFVRAAGPQQVARGKPRSRSHHFGPYEALATSPRPVRLIHVLEAIATHDDIVTRALTTAKLPGWSERIRSIDNSPGKSGISALWPKTNPPEVLSQLAQAWEEGPQRHMTASHKEVFQMRQRFIGRMSIKVIS